MRERAGTGGPDPLHAAGGGFPPAKGPNGAPRPLYPFIASHLGLSYNGPILGGKGAAPLPSAFHRRRRGVVPREPGGVNAGEN